MKIKPLNGTVITSHLNADFDAMASMIAAGLLYPGSVLIFPGSQERNLRNFFIHSAIYMFNFKNSKDVDLESVKRLVVVDTRQPSRLEHVKELLQRTDIEIHIYDHHPEAEGDISGARTMIKPWGACTSILTAEIEKKQLKPSPDEATVMGLGIFEDTGLFTFNSTTEYDFKAAAFLKTMGMDLVSVSDLLTRELSAEQISLLNDLLKAAVSHDIKGMKVVITEIAVDHYIHDFAQLVHKMMDMENMSVIVAIAQMQDRVQVVARSRMSEVDVGYICTALGGGGHSYAASASVKEKSLVQVREEIMALLYSQINPRSILSRDIMSKPAVVIESNRSIKTALGIITGLGINVLPVVEPGTRRCIGLLDRNIASRAVAHGLGAQSVREYMSQDYASVSPEADFYPIMQLIVSRRQPLVPVISGDTVEGVITRSDIMNLFIEESSRASKDGEAGRSKERSVKKTMQELLPRNISALLLLAGELADTLGCNVYVVGGFVRDLLMRRRNLDIDLVIEGDGIMFATMLASELGGRVRTHPKFKTAVVIYHKDGQENRIDVATARLEYYENPAALPMVELSSLKMDLYRRDFTVNAMAVQLNKNHYGRLVDFFGGQRDIKEKTIRVIHSLSFIEDPTRIMRAARFETRYGFRMDGQVERLIKNALDLKIIAKLSGIRIFNEIKLISLEKKAPACFVRLDELGVLAAIHPAMALTAAKRELLEETERILTWYSLLYHAEKPQLWKPYLFLFCLDAEQEEAAEVARRLLFSSRINSQFMEERASVIKAIEKLSRWDAKATDRASRAYQVLNDMSLEAILFLMIRSRREEIRKIISYYLTTLKDIKIEVSGHDLMAIYRLKQGPELGLLMRKLLLAKVDGLAPTMEDEISLAGSMLRTAAQLESGNEASL